MAIISSGNFEKACKDEWSGIPISNMDCGEIEVEKWRSEVTNRVEDLNEEVYNLQVNIKAKSE